MGNSPDFHAPFLALSGPAATKNQRIPQRICASNSPSRVAHPEELGFNSAL
jgi:hypothetical protein